MELKPGWLRRQIKAVKKEVKNLPEAAKQLRAINLELYKKYNGKK